MLSRNISVDFKRSMAFTQGNNPIYPELVMVCGLHFLGLDSNIPDLKDTYGMSKSSVKQVINMFLAAVDNNTDCSELQIKLLDPANVFELNKVTGKFAEILAPYLLMGGCLGVIDVGLLVQRSRTILVIRLITTVGITNVMV